MIEARELRIGNWVSFGTNTDRHFQITSQGINDCAIANIAESPYQYEPIPLTEQWLIDFGFRHNPIVLISRQYLLDIGRNRMLSFSDVGTSNFMVWLQSVEGNKVTDLVCIHNWDYDKDMFLHQFQNLIFALTGKELTKK